MWVAHPEWGTYCQEGLGGKRREAWSKDLRWLVRSGVNFGSSEQFWALLKCWSFFAEALRAACADQQAGWQGSSSGLKKTNKSSLSWAISLRYAKEKGWIAFLSGLDFVSGPVCSVGVYKDSVYSFCAKTYYFFCAEPRTPWWNTCVPGYIFVVIVMLSVAKLQRFGCCIFFFVCCRWDCSCSVVHLCL